MPFNSETILLDDGEVYDIIVEVVGDENSLEFCALVDLHLEDRDMDAALAMNGLTYHDLRPLVDEVEEKATELREQKRSTPTEDDPDGD